jgi:SOS-response transcriptional repressor LexA/predicted transcriptional regulator
MKTLGEFAKERLRRLGKNQKAFAAKLGVSPAYVSQIFTGKKNPPDLSKARNRPQLRIWAEFLAATEEDIVDLVRLQLHGVTVRADPRYRRLRKLLLERLGQGSRDLGEEIRRLELHPAENQAIGALVRMYLMVQQEFPAHHAYGATRFREVSERARSNKSFLESELVNFFEERIFTWSWDPEANEVRLCCESHDLIDALEMIERIGDPDSDVQFRRTVPVVGHVSAGEGFMFTDGGYPVGEGFERVELPPGVDPVLASRLYCVRVRGNSLKEFINEGALLFIKPESWEEIKDGDLVIFKDRTDNRAFVKKVEFSGESLILKSMNPLYGNIVLKKTDLTLLERVMSLVL